MLIGQAILGHLRENGARAEDKPRSRLGALPTASGGIARAAYRLMKEARIATRAVLQQAGLTAHQMDRPDVRFPVKSQIAFLNAAAQALDKPFLGFELARAIDLRELGLLYYIQASSTSLHDALARAARYSAIHNEGLLLRYRELRDVAVSFRHVGVPRADDSHQIEFFATMMVRICRHLTARNLTPRISMRCWRGIATKLLFSGKRKQVHGGCASRMRLFRCCRTVRQISKRFVACSARAVEPSFGGSPPNTRPSRRFSTIFGEI